MSLVHSTERCVGQRREFGTLRPETPTPRLLGRLAAAAYVTARDVGCGWRTAAAFALLHVVQRVAYFAGWVAERGGG